MSSTHARQARRLIEPSNRVVGVVRRDEYVAVCMIGMKDGSEPLRDRSGRPFTDRAIPSNVNVAPGPPNCHGASGTSTKPPHSAHC